MAIFKPYKIQSSQLEDLPITEGQIIVTTDTQKIYLDESASSRIELIPVPTKTSDLVNDMNFMSGMTILSYGNSTWNDFITAYTAKHVVYTRASSGSNPASGSQTRLAFMAYVNSADSPTEVEFQYYRSVSSHSATQQGDQTYVYKLNKTNGWSVTVRENYTKVVGSDGITGTWSSGTLTLKHDASGVTAGTYKSVTVDAKGHVTAGSNPTTLSGYGITDASISNQTVTLGSNSVTVPTKTSDLTNDSGYTTNTGTITGVSVNGTSIATSGTANITSVPASILTGAIPSAVTATTQSQGDSSTKIATTAYVDTAIDNLPEPMVFKGSLGTGGTITSLPTDGSANIGDTYKVITAGTYASQSAKVGDTFICLTKTSSANTWELIPSGDEPSGTVTSVTLKATSPIAIDSTSAITTSGTRTLSHANSGVTSGTYKSVTVNETGHITAGTNPTTLSGYGITDAKIENGTVTLGSNTITPLTSSSTLNATKLSGTIPSGCYTDTKNTAGSTNTSDTIYLIGAKTQAANPQTYSNNSLYFSNGLHSQATAGQGDTMVTIAQSSSGISLSYEVGLLKDYSIDIDTSGITMIGVVTPTSDTMAVNKKYVDDNFSTTDTKNTAGTTNTTDKIYLAGGKSQGDNPQTYSNVNCYASGGKLYSNAKEVVTLSDTQALTNKTYNGYTLAAASAKAVDTSISAASTSVNLPTSAAVATFVEGKGYVTTDTKNTAGSTDTSSKIYLIGATSQAANPQTYSDNEIYATSGVLTTKSVQVGGTAATIQYNSTDKCIEFNFS